MGEVYRARDTKLNRDVAAEGPAGGVHGDADRVARFEREARAARLAQSSAHRFHLRSRRQPAVRPPWCSSWSRATRWTIACAAGPLPARGGFGRRAADRRCARRRSRVRHHPSRSQARPTSRSRPMGWSRCSTSVSAKALAAEGSEPDPSKSPTMTADGTIARCDSRHRRVHEPGAGARSAGRQAHRHLGVRLRALRDVDGLFSVRTTRPSRTPSLPSSVPNRSGRRCRPTRRSASDAC